MIVAGSREEEAVERNSGDHERDEAVSEIASILARGYLRLVKSRCREWDVDVRADSDNAVLTENRLDCSSDRSNHSEPV